MAKISKEDAKTEPQPQAPDDVDGEDSKDPSSCTSNSKPGSSNPAVTVTVTASTEEKHSTVSPNEEKSFEAKDTTAVEDDGNARPSEPFAGRGGAGPGPGPGAFPGQGPHPHRPFAQYPYPPNSPYGASAPLPPYGYYSPSPYYGPGTGPGPGSPHPPHPNAHQHHHYHYPPHGSAPPPSQQQQQQHEASSEGRPAASEDQRPPPNQPPYYGYPPPHAAYLPPPSEPPRTGAHSSSGGAAEGEDRQHQYNNYYPYPPPPHPGYEYPSPAGNYPPPPPGYHDPHYHGHLPPPPPHDAAHSAYPVPPRMPDKIMEDADASNQSKGQETGQQPHDASSEGAVSHAPDSVEEPDLARIKTYVRSVAPRNPQTFARRQTKNAASRRRASLQRTKLAEIEEKHPEQRTDEESHMLKLHNDRRSRKNDRSRERALERKQEVDRILAKDPTKRTKLELSFLETTLSKRARKNEGDRLRRARLKALGISQRSSKAKPGVPARGPLPYSIPGPMGGHPNMPPQGPPYHPPLPPPHYHYGHNPYSHQFTISQQQQQPPPHGTHNDDQGAPQPPASPKAAEEPDHHASPSNGNALAQAEEV